MEQVESIAGDEANEGASEAEASLPSPDAAVERGRENTLSQGVILLADGFTVSVPAAERFCILRAKIERKNLERRAFQVIGVTSAAPAEGKSVCAVNLARALSVDPFGKTILVDCDLRKPTTHLFFRHDRSLGLSDALQQRKLTREQIRSVSPNLDMLTAGAAVPDPAECLMQPELTHFFAQLRKYYRSVVVDLPPLLLCSEAIAVSALLDSVLVVVRAGRTDKRMVRDAVHLLDPEKLLGVIFNEGTDPSSGYLDYSYYSVGLARSGT